MNVDYDAFLAAMRPLYQQGRYTEILDRMGADMSRSHEFKAAAFADYVTTEHDVIVSTYPKSGTTWTIQIAYQLGFLGAGEFDEIDAVVPWPDKLIPIDNNPALDDHAHLADSPTGLHVIKSHLEAEYMPTAGDGRFITVIRNPKDMLVSLIHFENEFNELLFSHTIPAATFADAFVTDRFLYQQWPAFIDSWWQLRSRPDVLVLFYEDMRADAQAAVRQIAAFLEIEPTDEQLAAVIERSSFDYMRANAEAFAPPAEGAGKVTLVREGRTGSGRTELTADQQQAIDDWCTGEFDRLGSDFPYERYRIVDDE